VGDAVESALALAVHAGAQLADLVQLGFKVEPTVLVLVLKTLMDLRNLLVNHTILAVQLPDLLRELLPTTGGLLLEFEFGEIVELASSGVAALGGEGLVEYAWRFGVPGYEAVLRVLHDYPGFVENIEIAVGESRVGGFVASA
jgi:hypothetical protein